MAPSPESLRRKHVYDDCCTGSKRRHTSCLFAGAVLVRPAVLSLTAVFACLVASAAAWDLWTPVGPRPDRVIDEARLTCFVSPAGDDEADGRTRQSAFRSMQRAADAVRPGEIDAVDHNGDTIAGSGFNRAAFDAGKFVDGVKGKSLRP